MERQPYEMIKGKKPSVKHFHIFGCKCYVLRVHPEQLSKFEAKSDEAIFLGYAPATKAFKVFNMRTKSVMESIQVAFDDIKVEGIQDAESHDNLEFENLKTSDIESSECDDVSHFTPHPPQENASAEGERLQEEQETISSTNSENTQEFGTSGSSSSTSDTRLSKSSSSGSESTEVLNDTGEATSHTLNSSTRDSSGLGGETSMNNLPPAIKWSRDHIEDLIIGDPSSGVQTRRATQNECIFSCFLSKNEPKKIDEALQDPDWIITMQEELNQFERNKVWELVPRPKNRSSHWCKVGIPK